MSKQNELVLNSTSELALTGNALGSEYGHQDYGKIQLTGVRLVSEEWLLGLVEQLETLRAEAERMKGFFEGYMAWSEKTEWMQGTFTAKELGKHRADVLKERLESALSRAEQAEGRLAVAANFAPKILQCPCGEYYPQGFLCQCGEDNEDG